MRLAMLDVDGTLRGEDDWKPGALDMLAWLHERNIPIALCSGRPVNSLMLTAHERPEITYICPGSGSMALKRVGDDWVTVGERFLPPASVRWTVDRAKEIAMEVWAYTTTGWLVEEMSEMVRFDMNMTGATPTFTEFGRRNDVIKMLIFARTPEQEAFVEQVKGLPGFDVVSSYPGYLDIVHIDSAKTKGGDFLLRDLGLDWPDAVAAGDGENDLGMLARAGVALCMPPMRQDLLAPIQPGQRRRDCVDMRDALAFLRSL